MPPKILDPVDSFTNADVQRCPYPLIRKMHETTPIALDPTTGHYVVVDYDDIVYVNQHTELFSNQTSVILGVGAETPEIMELYEVEGCTRMHTLVTNDPPSHTPYRAIVDKVFAPSVVKAMEPYLHELTNELIDGFAAKGAANLKRDFCIRLPLYVIADQLGARRQDWEKIREWSDSVIDLINPHLSDEERLDICKVHVEGQKYLKERWEEYSRKEPDNTLFSRLAYAEVEGRRLTQQEFVNIADIFMGAGNETTAGALEHCIVQLIRSPYIREAMEADFGLIPNFVEEMLRLHAPSAHIWREAMEDVELSGVAIPKGSILMCSYLAGNYDPDKFENPEEINLNRKGLRNHLTFGRGIHYCVGHQLARAELRIALECVLTRLKNLRFDPACPEPGLAPIFHSHNVDQLTVVFTPEQPSS